MKEHNNLQPNEFLIDYDRYLYPIFLNLHKLVPDSIQISRVKEFRYNQCNRMGFHHSFRFPSCDVSSIQIDAFVNSKPRLDILTRLGYTIPEYYLKNVPVGFCESSQVIRRYDGHSAVLLPIVFSRLKSIQHMAPILRTVYQEPCCVSMVCLYISVIEYLESYHIELSDFRQHVHMYLESLLEVCLFLDYKYHIGEYANA